MGEELTPAPTGRALLPGILATAAVMSLPVLLPGALGWLNSLVPLPVFYYLVLAGRRRGAAIVAGGLLLATVLALVLGTAQALMVSLLLIPLGYILARAALRKEPPLRAWMKGVSFLVGSLLFIWLIHGASGQTNPYAVLTDALDKGLAAGRDLYRESAEVPPETLKQIEAAYDELRVILPKVLPALILIMAMITVWVNLAIGNWLLEKRAGFAPWPSSRQWRLPDWLIWGVILAMIAILTSPERINVFGLNLLLILGLLYFFQGLGVLGSLLARWSVPPPLQALIYFLFIIQYYGVILIAILGLIDIWADFRRPREQKDL
jgi:uncharacterized protein YybS (DUF2232 family)